MYSQTRTKSKVKYPIRKIYTIFLHSDLNYKINHYKYIDNAIEIEWDTGEGFFSDKYKLRVWPENGHLEIMEI